MFKDGIDNLFDEMEQQPKGHKEIKDSELRRSIDAECKQLRMVKDLEFKKWLKPATFYPEPKIIDVEYEDIT